MTSFKNFAKGGIDDGLLTGTRSVRHKQNREKKVSSRIEKVWATDFERCVNQEDYKKYILKYSKYESNKYVLQAQEKIKELEALDKKGITREKARQRVSQPAMMSSTGGNGKPTKYKIIQMCVKYVIWVFVIGGIGIYSYNQYLRSENEITTDFVNDQPTQLQNSQDIYNIPTYSEETIEAEPVEEVDSESESEITEYDCYICGSTGSCQLCFGVCSCSVCGGTGQMFSVFYGDEIGEGRMTECGNCGGSGRCPSCDGTGACFACHGNGKVDIEF